MNIALDEARKASDMVYPNPRVGCVIVQNGEIVSRGYHKQYGGPHAEVDAINNCKVELNKATMYVTLEPCNHEGKTPPCTELIDSQKFERIVIACKDPNPIINNGLQALMKKGLTIDFNVCEDEAKFINKRFFTLLSDLDGQALHAQSLGFNHPTKKKMVNFESNLPLQFKKILNLLENLSG